jgi:hypothetical protein
VRYIERKPVYACIVRDAWEYAWSSAADHTGKAAQDRIVESDDTLRLSPLSTLRMSKIMFYRFHYGNDI